MTEAELRVAHPPRRCPTPGCDQTLEARLTELGLHQSTGWLPGAVFECTCGWKRTERLKEPRGAL